MQACMAVNGKPQDLRRSRVGAQFAKRDVVTTWKWRLRFNHPLILLMTSISEGKAKMRKQASYGAHIVFHVFAERYGHATPNLDRYVKSEHVDDI